MSDRDLYLPEDVERLGPVFTFVSEVAFDELDAFGMLHNSRYIIHVNRADLAWTDEITGREPGGAFGPDQFVFVRAISTEYLAACRHPGPMRIEMYPIRWGRTSSTVGFRCSDESGELVYARGRRTVVKMDPATGQAAPWSDELNDYAARDAERWQVS